MDARMNGWMDGCSLSHCRWENSLASFFLFLLKIVVYHQHIGQPEIFRDLLSDSAQGFCLILMFHSNLKFFFSFYLSDVVSPSSENFKVVGVHRILRKQSQHSTLLSKHLPQTNCFMNHVQLSLIVCLCVFSGFRFVPVERRSLQSQFEVNPLRSDSPFLQHLCVTDTW